MTILMRAMGIPAILAAMLPASTLYSIVDLGGLGGSTSAAYKISDSGGVVGWSQTAGGDQHAFVSPGGGALRDLTPGSNYAVGSAIDELGNVVGTSYLNGQPHGMIWSGGGTTDLGAGTFATGIGQGGVIAGGDGHAFTYTNGVGRDLGTLDGGTWSSAADINLQGTVVGDAMTSSGSLQGFVWTPTTGMVAIGTFGGADSHATGINDSGEVIGTASLPGGDQHAYVAVNGVLTDLGTLGGGNSFAYGINASGSIVGYSWLASGPNPHAFLWSRGVLLDLNALLPAGSGWELLQAYGINDGGQIVGSGIFHGQVRAFELNPLSVSQHAPANLAAAVPEIGTNFMVGIGLCLILWGTLRRHL